jgi:large subunit ribosomal protein L22
MLVVAKGKFLRISPAKVRQVAALICDKGVNEAQAILFHINKRPKEYLIKILNSAIANAKTKGFKPEQLYVSKVICNLGPVWKRYRAAAFGRATEIRKRTAHIRIELDLKS